MAKYVIDGETLSGLANALRKVTGETRTYTPAEMIDAVTNIMETGTYILVDEDGVEVPAVFVDNETVFTATANDIRLGKTAVTEAGVTEGEKEIPGYFTEEGFVEISPGASLTIEMFSDMCNYTKLQAIVCAFNTTIANSVAAEKVSIDSKVYDVRSTVALTSVVVDTVNQCINFGLSNTGAKPIIIRYFTCKEVP